MKQKYICSNGIKLFNIIANLLLNVLNILSPNLVFFICSTNSLSFSISCDTLHPHTKDTPVIIEYNFNNKMLKKQSIKKGGFLIMETREEKLERMCLENYIIREE